MVGAGPAATGVPVVVGVAVAGDALFGGAGGPFAGVSAAAGAGSAAAAAASVPPSPPSPDSFHGGGDRRRPEAALVGRGRDGRGLCRLLGRPAPCRCRPTSPPRLRPAGLASGAAAASTGVLAAPLRALVRGARALGDAPRGLPRCPACRSIWSMMLAFNAHNAGLTPIASAMTASSSRSLPSRTDRSSACGAILMVLPPSRVPSGPPPVRSVGFGGLPAKSGRPGRSGRSGTASNAWPTTRSMTWERVASRLYDGMIATLCSSASDLM